MTPLQPDQPLAVTLEAQQWNVVLGALQEAPWRIADPVIRKIAQQIEQSQQTQGEPLPAAQRSNGADAHAPN